MRIKKLLLSILTIFTLGLSGCDFLNPLGPSSGGGNNPASEGASVTLGENILYFYSLGQQYGLDCHLDGTGTVKWESSNNSIVSVNNNGLLTTVGAGKCVITASIGRSNAKCDVYVRPINSISISVSKNECNVGDKLMLYVETSPSYSVTELLAEGSMTITTSNPEAVKISYPYVECINSGFAKISAYMGNYSSNDEELKINGPDSSISYGTKHKGTIDDPLDNEDAVKVGEYVSRFPENKPVFYIKGIVASFYSSPNGVRSVAFYLMENVAGSQRFEAYACTKEGGIALTEEDIWVGGEVLFYGQIVYFSRHNQPETNPSTLVSCTNTSIERKTIDSTVFDAVQLCFNLPDLMATIDYYHVTGYVFHRKGNQLFLADTPNVEPDFNTKNYMCLYSMPDEILKTFNKGAKVEVTGTIKNYHNQPEFDNYELQLKLLEEGTPWIGEPNHYFNVQEAFDYVNSHDSSIYSQEVFEIIGTINEEAVTSTNGLVSFKMNSGTSIYAEAIEINCLSEYKDRVLPNQPVRVRCYVSLASDHIVLHDGEIVE